MGPHEGRAPSDSDRDLVLAFQAGDRAAYDEMYHRYHQRVISVCIRILNDRQDAEEAAQETFLRAYQALPRFNGNFRLGAWLARIAANASVDQLRLKTRAPLVGLPSEQEEVVGATDPEQIVAGSDPRLEEAISVMKPIHARALAWRSIEGMSHKEIAAQLAMSPNQVKALLHRARTSFKKAWEQAEGWAIAPVLALRSMWGDRSQGQTNPLVTATPGMTPLLAEKVAATALVVAVALSGLPTLPDESMPETTAPSEALRSKRVVPRLSEKSLDVIHPATKPAPAVEADTPVADDLAPIVQKIDGVLKGHDDFQEERKREEDRDDDPTARAASTARDVLKKVRDVIPPLGGDSSITP